MRRRRMASISMGVGLLIGIAGCGNDDGTRVDATEGPAASGPARWASTIAGDGMQVGWLLDRTDAGELVVVGTTEKTAKFGAAGSIKATSDSDIFVAWVTDSGQIQRARLFGKTGFHFPTSLAIAKTGTIVISGVADGDTDFGGGTLQGAGSADAFLAGLAPDGSQRFALRVGDAGTQTGGSVALADDGSMYWSGSFEGTMSLGGTTLTSAGKSDVFVAHLDPNGNVQWAISLGGAGADIDGSIAIGPQGNILLGGYYEGTPDLGKGALPDTGQTDGEMLVALDPQSGAVLWSRGAPNTAGFFLASLHTTANGAAYLIGTLSGTIDAFGQKLTAPGGEGLAIVPIDANGTAQTPQIFASERLGQVFATRSPDGNLILAGTFEGSIALGNKVLKAAGESDLFVAWFDKQGAIQRAERIGGTGTEQAGGLTLTKSGQVALTGTFDGTMNPGIGEISSIGGPDAFVMLLR